VAGDFNVAAGQFDFAVDEFPANSELSELWKSAWPSPPPDDFQKSLRACLLHITIRRNGTLIGFVKVATDGGVHAFLLDPTIHPDFGRRGLGVELVARARDLAKQRGAEWLHVDFEPHLAKFYAACGFSPTLAGLVRL
jgi:GNAT superfamily N-acetyltransferase